jgi:MinD superfamily P-loop ATPase
MKQLVVLSGKGGSGKTVVAGALAHLAHADSAVPDPVLVDADVDASNLHLLLRPSRSDEHPFTCGSTAGVAEEVCLQCGICRDICRFNAIRGSLDNGGFQVDPLACEGCAACFYQCPADAIVLMPRRAGHWRASQTPYGVLFDARLRPAAENSGKLVTLVKERARQFAAGDGFMLVDGPPGIACPAIAAASGSDYLLLVAEPGVAGHYDLERALDMAGHFRLVSLVCVNKADLNIEGSDRIERTCASRGARVVGKIPFDETVPRAMAQRVPVTEYRPESAAGRAMAGLWERLKPLMVL